MNAPAPLEPGLYWYQDELGQWTPLLVSEAGQQIALMGFAAIDGVVTVSGPLRRPKE